MQCRGVWPYALSCPASARLAQRACALTAPQLRIREFRAGMVQAHRGGEARRHAFGRFRRRAVAPVPPGGRCLHAKNLASKSKSRPATPPTRSIACSRNAKPGRYTVDVALISVARKPAATGAVGIGGAFRAPADPSRSGGHFALVSAAAIGTATKIRKYAFIYHAAVEDQYEVWYNTDKLKEAEIADDQETDRYFRPALERQDPGPGNGRPIRHTPDDRQLTSSRTEGRNGYAPIY